MIRSILALSLMMSPILSCGLAVAQETRPRSLPPAKRTVSADAYRAPAQYDDGGSGGIDKITFDIGLSAGNSSGFNYTEANLGINAYFLDYFAWRNSIFSRFVTGAENVYGLDTSLRGIFSVGNAAGGFTAFAGPGWRFVSKGDAAPFAEAGVVVKLAGISLGGGAKSVFNSAIRSGAENDTQYFLILAGGGTL
ncbi:MAG: hypothetical protein V4760_06115 [Bdellovibrionota bacterium]